MRLEDRVVIVTGAARGIGRVYAKAAAAEGAKVVVSDVLDGEEAVEEIRKGGGEAMYVRADVSDEQSVNALARSAYDRYGRVDGLVNNAARVADIRLGGFDEVSVEEWDAVMAVNVKGPWLAARAVYPFMKARGAGKIINIASGAPFKGNPLFSHYSVSKGAVLALTRVLARSMGKDGICVNTVAPGFTHTDFHERMGLPPGQEGVPGPLWLDARDVVAESLRDAARGRGVSIPSLRYKALTRIAALLPASVAAGVGTRGR